MKNILVLFNKKTKQKCCTTNVKHLILLTLVGPNYLTLIFLSNDLGWNFVNKKISVSSFLHLYNLIRLVKV